MGIEVRIPKEITEYQEKVIFGMSIRQLGCVTGAIALGTGSYIVLKEPLGEDVASYITILETMPILAFGFIKKNGFTFEKYVGLILKHMVGINQRKYGTELEIDSIVGLGNKKDVKEKRGIWNAIPIIQTRKRSKECRECEGFRISRKDKKRKVQAARQEIKAAKQEYRAAQQGVIAQAKKRSCPKNYPTNY